ncbi:MAG: hypothetical protein DI563_21265 [Variovorax paradoxus]|uniref:Uncharacterized protein n=1 Tax=Variovorax paradoxus TaxID=34073 RepID=A0A2W5PSB9_VARPD|nr:MAG: hypothetical protein DI563_21265 [Variovorax paradoxus]
MGMADVEFRQVPVRVDHMALPLGHGAFALDEQIKVAFAQQTHVVKRRLQRHAARSGIEWRNRLELAQLGHTRLAGAVGSGVAGNQDGQALAFAVAAG